MGAESIEKRSQARPAQNMEAQTWARKCMQQYVKCMESDEEYKI
jgi:hypothetical protein